jgi:hypothetical protein
MKKLNVFACYLLFFITSMISNKLNASQTIMQQADQLIQQSYATVQAAKSVQFFMHQHSYYQLHETAPKPSIAEILFAISQLQDSYGFIADEQLRQQVLQVLRATITATKKALEKIELQATNNQTLSANDLKMLQTVQYQNKLLRTKFSQVKHRSAQSYLAQPSTWYLIAGAFVMISLGSMAYYYNFLAQDNEQVFILTAEQEKQVEANPAHHQARDILAAVATSKEKIDVSVYVPAAKNITTNLDPKLDKDLKKLIDTFIEIQEGGFWAKAKAKSNESALKQTYVKTLNSDPNIRLQAPDGKMWYPKDINVEKLVK